MDLAKILDELRAEHRQLTVCIECLESLARGSALEPKRASASKNTGMPKLPVKRVGKTSVDEPPFAE